MNRTKAIENLKKVFTNLTGQDPMIIREDVLARFDVDLKAFFPTPNHNDFERPINAFVVKEGTLYDLLIDDNYCIIPLIANEERKNFFNNQRYLVLYRCRNIFKLFTDIRAINSKIVFNDNGIWAYKFDSELYTDEKMAKRMIAKMEAEKEVLMEKRSETLFALQAASIESNVTAEAMEFLLRELELPKF